MALSYEDSATLMQNGAFVSRVKVSCLRFADYIYGEASDVPAHATRIKWAQQVTSNPELVAQQITPTVVMDPAVQADGAAISDTALQSATEHAVNKLI